MKKVILLLLLGISFMGLSQNNKPKKDEIKAQKIAFLTSELELTEKEAEKFWPIYNEYDTKMMANRKAHRSIMKKLRNFDGLSDDEAYSLSEKIISLEEERTQIRKTYLVKFAKVLGKKKGAKVFYAEEKFKRELFKKLRKNNHPQNGNPPVRP
jgi:Spy/CpxP family protein refolding chaperone